MAILISRVASMRPLNPNSTLATVPPDAQPQGQHAAQGFSIALIRPDYRRPRHITPNRRRRAAARVLSARPDRARPCRAVPAMCHKKSCCSTTSALRADKRCFGWGPSPHTRPPQLGKGLPHLSLLVSASCCCLTLSYPNTSQHVRPRSARAKDPRRCYRVSPVPAHAHVVLSDREGSFDVSP